MKNKPIGVFDSGLGGLTAVKELLNILPNEDIIYFGDTGRVPYGNRSCETILKYATEDVAFLMSFGVKMIIAACGTVSSVATRLGVDLSIPFTGVVEPTAKKASLVTKNGRVGVIGTAATIKTSSYKKEIKKINPNIEVFEKACPLFVPLVENGFIGDDPITVLTVERYLKELKEKNIDTLILGCTHYPIIEPIIASFMGKNVAIVNSGKETALFALQELGRRKLLNDKKCNGECSFFVSDSVESFSETAKLFLCKDIKKSVKKIDISDLVL